MGFSEEIKNEEFTRLKEFLDSVEIPAEVMPKGELFEETTLLVCLPTIEDIAAEDMTEDDLHLAAGYLLDLDDMEQRLAKYLLFYTQIKVDVSAMDDLAVLVMLNELNRTVRVGHYFYGHVDSQEEKSVQYRTTVAGVDGEPFHEGLVADAILEMGVAYDTAKAAFEKAGEQMKNR